MSKYSKEFRQSVIQRTLQPDNPGLIAIAEEAGVPVNTLYSWLHYFRKKGESPVRKPDPNNRSITEKHELLLEHAAVPPEQIGEWMRLKGVHEEHLKLWRTEIRELLNTRKNNRSMTNTTDKKRVKELELELRRKDRALAELSAEVILKKKLMGIVFEQDEEQKTT